MLYFLDLLGTMAFAVSGAYHARSTGLNIFATVLLGTVTAVGGGTVRDLIIGRTPLFYLIDSNYFLVCIFAGVCTYLIPSFFKKNYLTCIFTGVITGVGGGVIKKCHDGKHSLRIQVL